MTFQEIVDVTREIALHESDEVLAAWIYCLVRSPSVRVAVARATPPSKEELNRLMERSKIARELIEGLEAPSVEKKIFEISRKDARIGELLLKFYEEYLNLVEVLAKHGNEREPKTRDVKPIVE